MPLLPSHRNLELKARDPDPSRSRLACETMQAESRGLLAQRDTYFQGPAGRLKLREESDSAHLIFYERPDLPGLRESQYQYAEIKEPNLVLDVLTSTLGVEAVVVKERRLFIWEGIRIHLDDVDGLGHFIELEAIASPDSDLLRERSQLAIARRNLGIEAASMIAESYCDMV